MAERTWHLPPDIIPIYRKDDVCRCGQPSRAGFSYNPETEYWVCTNCRKPSSYMIRECENCGKLFLPAKPSKYPAQLYADVCKECKP